MREVIVKGKTIEEAIELGLKEINTTRDNVEVEVLQEGKAGFFNIIGNNFFKVKIILKDENLDYSALVDVVVNKVKDILKLMRFNLEVNGTVFGGRILIEMKGEDTKFIIGRAGEVLDAFEDFMNLMISNEYKNKIKIEIDVDNYYRADREEKIKVMLKNIAENVLKTGQSYKLYPMNRRERKIVHLFIDKYENLESLSQGEGRDRYIIISKKNKISFQ